MSFLADEASWSPLTPLLAHFTAQQLAALALADGTVSDAIVLAAHPVVVETENLAFLRRQIAHHELLEQSLTEQADVVRFTRIW